MPNEQPKYSIEYLLNYLMLHQHLTGEKLTTIALTPDFYTWYVQSAAQMAESYNMQPGFKDGKVMFNGVELTKKVKIALS